MKAKWAKGIRIKHGLYRLFGKCFEIHVLPIFYLSKHLFTIYLLFTANQRQKQGITEKQQ